MRPRRQLRKPLTEIFRGMPCCVLCFGAMTSRASSRSSRAPLRYSTSLPVLLSLGQVCLQQSTVSHCAGLGHSELRRGSEATFNYP